MIYANEDLPQGSAKWLDFRKTSGIGASEIPIIMGHYPPQWCTPYELFLQKIGKPAKPMSEDMERGRYEEQARNFLVNYLKNCNGQEENSVFCRNVYDRTGGIKTEDPNFVQYTVQHKHFPKIFSSFDGIDLKNKIITEIKCPKEGIFNKLLRNKVPKVPKTYITQVQTQLMIANSHWGITSGIFAPYFPEGLYYEDKKTGRVNLIRMILVKAELDLEYCAEIERVCKKFWNLVENRTWDKNWNI